MWSNWRRQFDPIGGVKDCNSVAGVFVVPPLRQQHERRHIRKRHWTRQDLHSGLPFPLVWLAALGPTAEASLRLSSKFAGTLGRPRVWIPCRRHATWGPATAVAPHGPRRDRWRWAIRIPGRRHGTWGGVPRVGSLAPDRSLGLSICSDSILEMRSEEIERINSSLWRWRLDWFSESVWFYSRVGRNTLWTNGQEWWAGCNGLTSLAQIDQ